MDSNARPRRPDSKSALAESLRPLCETSVPGMARYVRMRLRYHGYPSKPETMARVLQESYEAALGEIAGQQRIPRPGSFRKSLTHQARSALYRAVEEDQKVHLTAVVDAFEAGHADPWKSPVPARSIAKLTRSVLAGIDSVDGAPERILLRALMTGTHAPGQLSRLLDLPDLAPTLARAVCSLADALHGESLPALPGLLQSLKDEPHAPPSALLADAKPKDAESHRCAELSVLAGLTCAQIAKRVGRKEDAVRSTLADLGLGEAGPWQKSGAMLVDMVAFTRELEMRDLAGYIQGLCEPAAGAAAGPGHNWKLINRKTKVLAFWLKNVLTRVSSTTFGAGLTGPWLRARLSATRGAAADLRKWLADGNLTALEIGRAAPKSKLPAKLATLFSATCQPAGPDLTRPLVTLPAARSEAKDLQALTKTLTASVERALRGK